MEKKITKRDNFEAIIEVLAAAGKDDLADVMRHEVELMDNKAAKSKERAAKKKTDDLLLDAVKAVLTDELTTLADIAAKVEGDEVSASKVQYRLNALVKDGVAVKEQVKVEKGKKMAYKLADGSVEEA